MLMYACVHASIHMYVYYIYVSISMCTGVSICVYMYACGVCIPDIMFLFPL